MDQSNPAPQQPTEQDPSSQLFWNEQDPRAHLLTGPLVDQKNISSPETTPNELTSISGSQQQTTSLTASYLKGNRKQEDRTHTKAKDVIPEKQEFTSSNRAETEEHLPTKAFKYTDEQLFHFLKEDPVFRQSLQQCHKNIQGEIHANLKDHIKDLSLFNHVSSSTENSLSREETQQTFLEEIKQFENSKVEKKEMAETKLEALLSEGHNQSAKKSSSFLFETNRSENEETLIIQNNLTLHSPHLIRKSSKPRKKSIVEDHFVQWKNFFCTECLIKFHDASFYAEKSFWKNYSPEMTLSSVSNCFSISEEDLKNSVEVKSVGHRKQILYVFAKRMKDLEQRRGLFFFSHQLILYPIICPLKMDNSSVQHIFLSYRLLSLISRTRTAGKRRKQGSFLYLNSYSAHL